MYLHQKAFSYVLDFPSICLLSFPANPYNISREKSILGFCLPTLQTGGRNRDKIKLAAAYNSDLNHMRVKNMVIKRSNGRSDIIIFLTQVSMIFIQENAAFIQVLFYQD